MNSKIENIRIHCFDYPRDRIIGDSQISSSRVWIGALEIFDAQGISGLGFFQSLTAPLPNANFIREILNANGMQTMINQAPEGLIHRVTRPRGGNIQALPYHLDQALDQALWDLVAKRAELPLYQLLGGTKSKVKAYGSGVCFHLTDDQVFDFYTEATKHNFSGYKVKVGHDDISRDIGRLKQIVDIVGQDKLIMVDANEAWSAKEAITKIKAFERAGVPIYWVEDPILRTDIAGLKEVKQALDNTYLNAGEYLNLAGKKSIVENDAADVINIHGDFSSALRIGWLCAEKGIPIALGNTPMEMGSHIASALPEVLYTEHSMLNWDYIVQSPYKINKGFIELPDQAGHGLTLSSDAIAELKPTVS